MTFTIDGHPYEYEARNILSIFFPGVKIEILREGAPAGERWALSSLREDNGFLTARAIICWDGRCVEKSLVIGENPAVERLVCICLYHALCELTGTSSKWGVLTGIRPVKLVESLLNKGLHAKQVVQVLKKDYLVSEEKARLCIETAGEERKITALSTNRSFSLYLSVPFCPSRCSYCSFVSHSVEKAGKLIPAYVDCMIKEIAAAGESAARCGMKLETVYIGGGTPTVLTPDQLKRVLMAVREHFDVGAAKEYTCEAGRPDTIDKEKLMALKEGGVTRISINPQTMDDEVLRGIGRRHTAADAEESFALARNIGFTNINMDLIAGLPGDDEDGFRCTVNRILRLCPESITVHALSLKRASLLSSQADSFGQIGGEAAKMVDYAYGALKGAEYRPYYLYRQKNTAGNLENVGYAKRGYEGLYNVYIMSEVHSIFAVGAGAVTKICDPAVNRIERFFNYKYPYEYIERFPEVLRRKNDAEVLQKRILYESQIENI